MNKVKEQVRKISIYPNPVGDYLFLDTISQDPIQAQIFNVIGQNFVMKKKVQKSVLERLIPLLLFKIILPQKRIDIPFCKKYDKII
ncbi:MAG: T9SS type A sorting domain-containing protein [Saprospiraceae bacterium]|nr:T9SS type A sorting domain-containing protein [Saprospiraceae bacterium]